MKSPNLYIKKSLISFFALCAICMMGFANSGHSEKAPMVLVGNQVEVQISSSSDDAEENLSTGGVSLVSSDLELVTDGSAQLVGMRFQSIGVPQGARIVAAYIEFECDEASSSATNLTIKGEAIDDAPTFVGSNFNISNRNTTTASVSWAPSEAWVVNSKYKTSNFANVVQEIVDRSGWNINNNIAIILSGSGKRTAESFNGEAAAAPKLVVVYDNVVNTANLLKSSVQIDNATELFSFDPDPTCSSADWADSWTKFTCPDGFDIEEYDDGSIVAYGTFVGIANSNNRWDAYFRFENKRTWSEWQAMGRTYYESGAGSACTANHMDWHYYEVDSVASRFIGTNGYDNEGKISKIRHNPTSYMKGTQVGFGANNNSNPISCQTYDIRGWCNLSGDLNLSCVDFGFSIAGYEENNLGLLPNGDFEDDLDYWFTHASSSEIYITNDAYSGNKAARISGENRDIGIMKSPANPGESFIFSGYAKKDATVGWTSVAMRFYDSSNNELFINTAEVINPTYTFLTTGGIAPPNTAFVDLRLWKGTGAGDATYDNFTLNRVTNPANGNCQGITNSSFENAIGAEWSPWGSVSQSTDAIEGTYSALIGGSENGGISTSFSVLPNKNYNFSVSIKETGAINWSSIGIIFYDENWNNLSGNTTDQFSSTFQNYEITLQSPPNAVHGTLSVSKYGTGELYADAVCLNEVQVAEDCSNGIDDDGDGLVDGDDPDCTTCSANFFTNQSFENDLTGWNVNGSVSITSDAAFGAKAITLDNSTGSGGVYQEVSATHGDVFTLSAFAKRTGDNGTSFGIKYYNATGQLLSENYQNIRSNTYEEYTMAAMAPENTDYVQIIAWNGNNGSGATFWDELCIDKFSIPTTTCNNGCTGLPSFNNYIFSIDKTGNDDWLDYDNGNLNFCDNGDGTFAIEGYILNGQDADWQPSTPSPCGGDDSWYIDLTVSNMQSWKEFQGSYNVHADCPEAYLGLDYWDVAGTFVGHGCNAGKTVTVNSASNGYKLQAGYGGNLHSCGVGMSTWFNSEMDGHFVGADIYMNLDAACYRAMRPSVPCENFANNPEFDFNNDGWYLAVQGGNSATLTNDNTSQLSGANSARIDIAAASGTNWHIQMIQGKQTLESGQTYTISFDAKASGNRNIGVRLQDDASPYASHFSETVALTTSNQSFSFDFTSPVNKEGNIRLLFDVGHSSETVYIDNVVMSKPCNAVEICDNGIDDDGDGSIDKDDPDCFSCATGLLTNPDFSSDFAGWSDSGVTTIETESNGNKFARISAGNKSFYQDLPVTPGVDYTIKFLGRSTSVAGASVGLKFRDASGSNIGSDYNVNIINSDFREYFRTVTAPANAATVRVFGYNGLNNTADFDGMCLTVGSLEICGNGIDDDNDGLIDDVDPDCGSNCALTNHHPGFPIDMLGDNSGWLDYNLGPDLILEDNGDGTMSITGSLFNGTSTDFGGGQNFSSCGPDDAWSVNLTLSDKKSWSEWQAMGGINNIHSNCSANVADLDYWAISGILTGTGCNTGRTLTVDKAVGNYRLQVGYGAVNKDEDCNFGLSTWLDISEGSNSFGGDIYAFLDESCYSPTNCSVDISNITVSNCVDHALEDVATVDITIEWESTPANDTIELVLNGKTELIDVAGGVVSPHTIQLMVPADGSTNIPVTASWKNSSTCAGDADSFDAPGACSTGSIDCKILYLCGDNKFQDAEPWDHGMEVYLDRINGTESVTPAITKDGTNGLELYDPSNPSIALSISLSDYDLIVISPSSSGRTSINLVNALKTFEGGILNMDRRISDDLGMSAGEGWINTTPTAFYDDSNSFEIYNYDNSDPVYDQIKTVYGYNSGIGEEAYLWNDTLNMGANINGVFFAFDRNDVLPGITSHGARVQLGYFMDGFYYAHHDNDPIPSVSTSWFEPTKHLTERGKYYLEQALLLASADCGLEPEICTDGFDNDGDGQIDCADSDCSGTLSVSSSIPVIGCGGGGSQIDLVTTGTLPYSYVWSDMAPTAQWTFENNTDDVSGNGNNQNGGQTTSFAYSNDAVQGNHSGEFSGNDYVRYSIDGGFMERTFTERSFSVWLKPSGLTGNKTILDEGGATNGIALRLNDNILEAAVRNGSVQVNSTPITFPNDGAWHHVTMVFDQGEFVVYLDGNASTPVTAPYTAVGNHSGNGGLGFYDAGSGFGNGSGNYYSGLMDDVRFFIDQALNPNQVADLARNDGDRYHLKDGTYTATVTNGAYCVASENETLLIENYVNVTAGGTIAANQSICSGDTPALLTSTDVATGGSGSTILYQWESSTDNATWVIIGGAMALTYQPTALIQTTYYRRGASRDGCSNQIYSNTLTITVIDNVTDPGAIIGAEENCGSYDPSEISSLNAASGGQGGSIEYQWESSTDNATWTDISGALTESFNPPTITQTTFYRRKARRSSCAAYLISNVVEKTVVTNFNNGGTIGSGESVCGAYDPATITNIAAPSGGANGSVQYRWESRTTGTWAVISGAISFDYDPSTISETTEYRRLARRSPCSNWIFSNTVIKEVVAEPVAQITTAPTSNICGNVSYVFLADDAGATAATYIWNFGPHATPATAGGIGPHSVTFDFPSTAPSTTFDVDLDVVMNGCSLSDKVTLSGRPYIGTTAIAPRHPSSCGGTDGEIDIAALYPNGTNVQVSLDGGTTWETAGQLVFTGLTAGNYNVHMRYSDGDCDYNYGTFVLREPSSPTSGINEDYDVECNSNIKTFSAITDGSIDTYTWDFGADASPATANGAGPHSVTYSSTGAKTVTLQAVAAGCSAGYTEDFHLVNGLTDGGEIAANQFLCSDPDPDVLNSVVAASGGSGGNVIYQWQRRTKLNPNVWGAWQNIPGADQMEYDPGVLTEVTQYRRIAFREGCPDRVESNVIVVTPSTSPMANGETFSSVCPGQTFAENVSLNDVNVQNASYRVEVPPTNGTVTIFSDGSFFYNPNTTFCGVDQFTYEVCSDNGTCCSSAVVHLNLTDTEAPQLENIPNDITIHCDEEVPLPPFVRALENCLTVSLGLDEISTQGIDTCSLYDYEITRIWTATDYCGNANSASQKITVEDITAPDIYRIYTLPNGKKMVAGVMENVGEHWKYISLPISFPTKPAIFTQITSEVDGTTAVVQLRNISSSQFEMRLKEEEALDGKHGRESVAWFAFEQGAMTNGEVNEINVSTGGNSIGFAQNYGSDPIFLTGLQSTFEKDPTTVNVSNLTGSGVSVALIEEQSADTETTHINEKMAYLAMNNSGNLALASGEVYGEVGTENISTSWITVSLNNTYHNAVVVANTNSGNGDQPHLRIKNVTTTSFDIKLEEWEYNDGNHGTEKISYMVIEGSIPFDGSYSCDAIPGVLTEGMELVAVDNCDLTVRMQYTEELNTNNCAPDNILTRTWSSTDECGNATAYTRVLSIYDNTDPTFTAPADVQVSCLDDIDDLTLTGDVTDEADNCATDLEATYRDIFLTPFTCDSSFTVYREWMLDDGCGNTVIDTQLINISHQGVTMRLKMFLQGALYNSPDTLMRDDLRALGLIPNTEPYSDLAHFLHIGDGGGETVNPIVFDVTGPDAIVDWVFVEIRNGFQNDSIIGTRSALLQRDGDIVDIDGISPVKFSVVQPGNYNVAVRHRNHLGAMTKKTRLLTEDPGNSKIDFADLDKQSHSHTTGGLLANNIAWQDTDKDGQYYLCQNGVTIQVDESAVETLIENGATPGPCGDYVTIADGDWANSATWLNGNIPPVNLTEEVRINHHVTFDYNEAALNVLTNGLIWMENGSLTTTGEIFMNGGAFYSYNSDVIIGVNLRMEGISGGKTKWVQKGGKLEVDFSYTATNNVDSYLENVCMKVPNTTIIDNSNQWFTKTTLESDLANMTITNNAEVYFSETKAHFVEGSIGNYGGKVYGDIDAIWIESGTVTNTNIWEAQIFSICLSDGENDINGFNDSYLPDSIATVCEYMNAIFTVTDCDVTVPDTTTVNPLEDLIHGDVPLVKIGKVYASWAADLSGDRKTIYQGPSNDITPLLVQVITDKGNIYHLPNYIRNSYDNADLDMDGDVIYQGPNNDRSKLLFDVILRHPNNSQLLPNFIINEQLPR